LIISNRIVLDLHALGIEPDDTILVHSSLKSLGWVDGGANAVIDAFEECLPNGTLLMPALTFDNVTAENPRFSVLHTPCCIGVIPETFRKYPGVSRSVHPTHSVCAWGVNADTMTGRHYLDRTPVGENSPFRLLPEFNGKIIMLGCGLEPNTFMHGVEETAGTPYVFAEGQTLFNIDADGRNEDVYHITHDFKGVEQRYDRAAECIAIKSGKVLDADAYVINASELWAAATAKIMLDPWFFVDKI